MRRPPKKVRRNLTCEIEAAASSEGWSARLFGLCVRLTHVFRVLCLAHPPLWSGDSEVVEQKVSHAIQMCTNLTHSAEDRMCRRLESEYHDFTRRLESERCERQAMMDELRNDFSRQRATLDNATAGLAVMRQQAVVHGGFSQKDTDPSVVEIKSRMPKSSGLDGAQNLEDLRSIVRLHGDKLGALMCDVDALTTRMPEFAAEVKLELEKEAKVRSRENAEAVRRIESVSEALANKGENWSSLSKEMGVLAGNLDAVAIQVDAFNGPRGNVPSCFPLGAFVLSVPRSSG